jgi:hypothetical protein
VSDWAQAADQVRAAMAKSPSPPLEQAIFSISAHLLPTGGPEAYPKPKTVRRWITTLQKLERLEDDTAEEFVSDVAKLREHPVGSVELICRWANYDRIGALEAARKLVRGELTVEKLRQLEKKARDADDGHVSGRQHGYRLRRRVERWAPSQLGDGFAVVPAREADGPPGDLLYKRGHGPSSFASVLIFGPYQDLELYNTRLDSFLSELVGVAAHTLIERVIAVVPYRIRDYWDRLSLYRISGSHIEIFAVGYHEQEFRPVKLERSVGGAK